MRSPPRASPRAPLLAPLRASLHAPLGSSLRASPGASLLFSLRFSFRSSPRASLRASPRASRLAPRASLRASLRTAVPSAQTSKCKLSFRMQRFMFSAASSSAGSAERPATASQLKDVQRWLGEEPAASSTSAEVQRIREAVAVLSRPNPRQPDVQALQREWNVAFKKDKTWCKKADVVQELRSKVVEAAQKLQQQVPEDPAAAADPVRSRRSNYGSALLPATGSATCSSD